MEVNSSYHVQTNVSVERGIFGGITIHYIKGGY